MMDGNLKFKQDFRKNVQESNGIMDTNAKQAVEIFKKIQDPEPIDVIHMNQIIELNDYQGHIDNRQDFTRVVEDYTNILNNELDWWEIYQIENFANRHQDIIFENPNFQNFQDQIINKPLQKLAKNITQIKNDQSIKTKTDAIQHYTDTNKTHTSDSQNVHDNSVNTQLRDGYQLLKEKTPTLEKSKYIVDEIKVEMLKLSPEKRQKILRSLNTISSAESGVSSLNGDSEKNLLAFVWNRSKLPENKDNKENIKDAVLDSLQDITNDAGGSVCTIGRCTRIFNSLALLDHDKQLANGLCTTEQLRNDALDSSNKILKDTIQEYLVQDTNQKLKKVAESFETGLESDPVDEDIFKNIVIEKIKDNLETNFKHTTSPDTYEKLEKQCTDAIKYI
jgi:hypothetical protein